MANDLFKVGDQVIVSGINDVGVILDARPEIDTYVVEFPEIPNSVGYYNHKEMIKVESAFKPDKNDNPCRHEFREYRGFIENYKYCTKCDVKCP
jgi:hypothetical protein